MAALSNHVSLAIAVDTVGIARAGFGVPLFLSSTANGVFGASEYTREYSSSAEVVADFATAGCIESLIADAVFASAIKPTKLKIGKQALPETRVYTLVPAVANSTVYTIRVKGPGYSVSASYTSDSSATATEICDGLRTALATAFGSVTENCATSGTSTLILTANAAGGWFSVEVDDPTRWTSAGCTHADPGVATDLAAICLRDNDWYCLLMADPGNASILAAAAWAESNKKLFLGECAEPQAKTTAVGNSDTLDDLKTLGYARTAPVYCEKPSEAHGARWAGKCLPTEPGSESWKFHALTGATSTSNTSTQRTNLINRSANFLETVAGAKVMVEGTTADGGFIDTLRGTDWLEDDMSKAVFEVFVKAAAQGAKVPFTDDGVAMLVAAVRGSLKRAEARGIIASGWTVTAPLVASLTADDKAARRLPDVKFNATLAGAIHKVTISGVVTV